MTGTHCPKALSIPKRYDNTIRIKLLHYDRLPVIYAAVFFYTEPVSILKNNLYRICQALSNKVSHSSGFPPTPPPVFANKALYGAFANLLVELFLHKIPQTPVKIAIKHIYQSILYLLSV